MPPPHTQLPLHPYRLFHLSARLRLRDRPSPPPSSTNGDYYTLLLSSPLPSPTQKTINPVRAPKATQPSSSPAVPPPSSSTAIQGSDKGPENKVTFGKVLSGPSPRMRGLMRAEEGLGRPREPDNCCMSGCVNCVWDAYREEVEVWAAARRSGEGRGGGGGGGIGREIRGQGNGNEGGVGDLDEGYRGVDVGEEDWFEGVPVGIREFMNTEKRLRERREVDGTA